MIKIIKEDITKLNTDAIVNAANEYLIHGGGVAKAIACAAGPELEKESKEIIIKKKKLKVGEVVYTTSGRLSQRGIKYVIHVVGPRGTKPELLEKAIINVFKLAKKLKAKTIALPAISCGIFGFNKPLGAEIIFKIAKKYEKDFDEIFLVSLDNEIIRDWKKLFFLND